MPRVNGAPLLNRRQLLGRGFGTTVALGGVPALLAACGDDEEETPQSRAEPAVDTRPPADGEAIVGDVLDFALTSRYIVTDHSIAPAAKMTRTAFAPRLHGRPRDAGATGRTNVFMNGVKGSGPMEAQPSVFDSDPGDPVWSPYWDHFTYQ